MKSLRKKLIEKRHKEKFMLKKFKKPTIILTVILVSLIGIGAAKPVYNLTQFITGAIINKLWIVPATELTISSGAVTVTQSNHLIDTEGDAASDTLSTINTSDFDVADGQIIYLRAANSGRTVTLDTAGNIATGAVLSTTKSLALMYDSTLSKYVLISKNQTSLEDLDITGASDIGEALADDDEIPVYNTSGTSNAKSDISRLFTYTQGKYGSAITSGTLPYSNGSALVDSVYTQDGTTATVPNGALLVGDDSISTADCRMELGSGRTDSGNAYIDLVGDTTYTGYGARFRRSGGITGATSFYHRGTGYLSFIAQDAGYVGFYTDNTIRMKIDPTTGITNILYNAIVGGGALTGSEKLKVNGTTYLNGTTTINRVLLVGDANTSTQDCRVEIGDSRTGDGNSYFDLIGDTTYTDYGLRVIRSSGANAISGFYHRGTGNFNFTASEAATIAFNTNGGTKLDIAPTGIATFQNSVICGGGTLTGSESLKVTGDSVITGTHTAAMNRQTGTWHAYGGFQDESETLTISAVDTWTKITNATNDLFTALEADGMSISSDSLVLTNAGDYKGVITLSFSAGTGKDYQFRVYNTTQSRQEGYKIGASTTGAANYIAVTLPLYIEADAASDTYEIQVQCTTDATNPTFKHCVFELSYLHD